ncbi:MAG TPA: DUF1924 domain-containing protein [Noviherbaspirillum sp.]
MKLKICIIALAATLPLATSSFAGPREDLLARYAAAAREASPGFAGFSASRGEAFHARKFGSGKPDTPACTSCHSDSPRQAGRTLAGKTIAPMAVSMTPDRYADPAKVEKWFKRNCNEVLGRECTALEKGDWLTYMLSR